MDPIQQPKHTLYINNLNDKVNVDELKLNLYHLFSQYGFVVDIIARKTKKMRGQAFVVFSDVASAASAHRSMQNLQLFNKPMRIKFSKLEADIIVRIKGLQGKKRKDAPTTGGGDASTAAKKAKTAEDEANLATDGVEKLSVEATADVEEQTEQDMELNPDEIVLADDGDEEMPNNVLFVQNLPEDFASEMVTQLFERLEGFVEARKPPDQNVGFVEFDTILNATRGMESLQGFKISPQHAMLISYRRK